MNELGFVPIEEIQNVFVSELTEIEDDIRRNGVPMDHRIIFDWLDNIKGELFKRAKFNMSAYMHKNPIIKNAQKQEKDAEMVKSSRRETWQDKVKANRAEAIRETLR